MANIVKEANDPDKKAKEAEILIQASEKQSSLIKEFSELLSKQKTMFDNFNPKVEVRESNVNVKGFISYVVSSILVMITLAYVSYYFYEQKKEWKDRSSWRYDNYMKYRYLKVCGTWQTQSEIKKLDKIYDSQQAKIDSTTLAKEGELTGR